MTDFPILQDLGYLLLAATGMLFIARAVRIPPIVAYILAGLLLGPVFHLIEVSEPVELISEAGIALLLFLVGLELSLERIRDVGRAAVLAGGGQILLTAGGGYAIAAALGFPLAAAMLIALAVTFSSTVVVVKLLEQAGALTSLHGRIAVGVLLVQDVIVAVALTSLAGLGGPDALDIGSVTRGIVVAFLGMAGLVAAALLAARYVLPPLFGWLSGSLEMLFVWSLSWCFAFIIAAGALGLSIEIGAFVAGFSLAQSSYNDELIRRVQPLVNFFIAVFFVALGVHMELGAAAQHWLAAALLSGFVLLGKPTMLMALLPRFGYGERTAFFAATSLGQISEFSFIVASLGLAAGLLDAATLSLLTLVGLVTIGASALIVQNQSALYTLVRDAGLLRVFRAPPDRPPAEDPELRDHVIVIGMNALGRRLAGALTARGERVLAIDTDAGKLRGLPCRTVRGNVEHREVLDAAGFPHAKLLVSALQIEDINKLLAYRARVAGVPSSIHAFDTALANELTRLGATRLMVSKVDGIRSMLGELRTAGIVD